MLWYNFSRTASDKGEETLRPFHSSLKGRESNPFKLQITRQITTIGQKMYFDEVDQGYAI